MQKKRLLLIGGSTLAMTLAGLLVIPSFIDWSKYQTLATTKIAEATGYNVTIGKDFKVGFLPRPHLSAKQIVVSKQSTRPVASMATLESIDVSIALLPLITGRVDISSITLDTPIIQLITYKDGQDNWKPKTQDKPAQTDAAASSDDDGSVPDIVIGALNIKNGTFTYADETTGQKHALTIPKLKLKSDALTGPFEADGTIGYNQALMNIELTTGGYREGQSVPVSANISDTKSRASLSWNGVIATGDTPQAQGETNLKFTDLSGVLKDAGFDVSLPSLPATQLSGMVTASANKASLTNGSLQLDKTRFATAFDWQKSADDQTLKLTAETPDFINLDEWLKKLPAATAATPAAKTDTAATKNTAAKPLLPNIELPENMSGSVLLRAGGVQYKGQKTGALTLETSIPKGSKRADTRINLANAPGNAEIALTATLGANKLNGTLIATLPALKDTLSDWLGVVDAKTLAAPGMPTHASTELSFDVSGNTLNAKIDRMALGQTSMAGTVRYRTTTTRPQLAVNVEANLFNLPAPATSTTSAPAAAPAAKSGNPFAITAPALPFDVSFDVKLGRFARGNEVLTDIAAIGEYAGKSLTLKSAQATTKGGTVSASGSIGNIETLSGIDVTAAVRTSDLEGFYKALTSQALPITQTIGAFNAEAKAKGNAEKLDVNLTANVRGFTIGASGVLDNPFNPGLPSGLSLSLRHNDYIQAIRTFAPDFASGSGAPLAIKGDLAIKDKVYDLTNITATMGKSDLSGSIRADLTGAKPNIKADINSKNLDLGSFVGVDAKAPASGNASGVQTINANSASRWSNAPLDTSAMHAMNVDVSIKSAHLTYGTWVLDDAQLTAKLSDGNLRLSPVSAKIYGGTFSGDLTASAPQDSKALSVTFKANGKDADIGKFLSALTSSADKKADGIGAFNVDIQTSGASASALVSNVNGKADIATKSLVLYGMDLDKLAANLVEAFDGGWKGVLASIPQDGLATGSTKFKDLTHTFPIQKGVMVVDKFHMETTSANAMMNAAGQVNFPAWNLNINADVQVTQPKDVPVLGVHLSGPINKPNKSINSTALDNLLREKVGGQVNKLLEKNIKDENLRGIIGGVLGVQPQKQAPAQPTTTPPTQQPQQAPAQQKSKEQQLIEGLGGLLGGRR